MKKVLNIISNIFVYILIILLIIIIISKIQGIEYKVVLTPSMEPELPVGSLLVIKPTEYEDIKIGDDVTYIRSNSNVVVTHRVIQKEDGYITTQGIANDIADNPIAYENVIGVVKFNIPKIGYITIKFREFMQ